MISDNVNPHIDALPEESRLVSQAKTGDATAFVHLYDAYVEGIYRYVYFRVINDAAAEDITSQVFLNAWEHLGSYQEVDGSFVSWIHKIANSQVLDYYKTNLKTHEIDIDFLSIPADYGLKDEVQDLIKLETMRNHLRFLTADPKQSLISKILNRGTTNRNIARLLARLENDVHTLQVRTLQTVAKFLEYLNLGREVKPSPKFNAHTRLWLTQYLQFHSRRQQKVSLLWRMSLIYAVVIIALLFTGTAKAQSALPGDLLYSWKRTSELAWRTVSPDPVGTDIFLADRRLSEWIAVGKDPARSAAASNDYFDALTKLSSKNEGVPLVRLNPVLKAHRERLGDAGLSTLQLDNYLNSTTSATSISSVNITPNEGVQPSTIGSSEVVQPPAAGSGENGQPSRTDPNNVVVPVTEAPIDVGAAATELPTDITSAATPIITVDVSLPTAVPTEVAQPPTQAPTVAAPPATEIPPVTTLPVTDVPPVTAPPATDVAPVTAPTTDNSTGNVNPVGSPIPAPTVQTP
jgi:RNA polymerase sigma factor (sigma-70 family)